MKVMPNKLFKRTAPPSAGLPLNAGVRPLVMDQREIDIFEDLFYADLESWFSADIACCDNCYDEFISDWPHAYGANEAEFQKNGIPLDVFYSGGRLQQTYTQEEFSALVCQLVCPRCLSNLKYNIWAYELPFDVPHNFGSNVDAIVKTATSTPFLLLKNDFCKEVLSAISDLAGRSKKRKFSDPLFRGRATSNGPVAQELGQFGSAPKEFVLEGRYNHAGMPVLYLASDLQTCHSELRGVACTVLEFILTESIHVLDLIDPYSQHRGHDDLLNSLVYSALLSAKQHSEGHFRPHYVVSRFVADCARYSGFQAILYPSTRNSEKNFNLVVLDPEVHLLKHSTGHRYHVLAGA